jgi:isochorismate synthase
VSNSKSIPLEKLQMYCLGKGMDFVSYTLPGENQPISHIGKLSKFNSLGELPGAKGFVMAPFLLDEDPILHISQEITLQGWDAEIDSATGDLRLAMELLGIETSEGIDSPVDLNAAIDEVDIDHEGNDSLSRVQYIHQVENLISLIRSGRAEKVVLSRTKKINGVQPDLLPTLFRRLCHKYPQAFVYLFHSPLAGTWMGATPETLVRVERERFTTMALAGTKAYCDDVQVAWTEKEIREQAHVLHYIQNKLAAAGFPFHESNLQTIRAGQVVHLRSMFSGLLRNGPSDWRAIAQVLFPTPAVCGTEEAQALDVIRELETHPREYYCGFLGPYCDDANTDIFVNLRCMKVADGNAILYAGGGILAESDPQREWEETELKFRTLSDVIFETIQDPN